MNENSNRVFFKVMAVRTFLYGPKTICRKDMSHIQVAEINLLRYIKGWITTPYGSGSISTENKTKSGF